MHEYVMDYRTAELLLSVERVRYDMRLGLRDNLELEELFQAATFSLASVDNERLTNKSFLRILGSFMKEAEELCERISNEKSTPILGGSSEE